MDKVVLKSTEYVFDASEKQVIILKPTKLLTLENLLLITNTTTNDIIYNFGCDGFGGTIDEDNRCIALEYDTTGMSDSDALQIVCHTNVALADLNDMLILIREQTQVQQEICESNKEIVKYLKKIYNPK